MIILFSTGHVLASGAFPLSDPSVALIGRSSTQIIMEKDNLLDIALDHNVGYNEIVEANRDVDPWVPTKGARITIPTAWILPDVMEDGIVVNLAELRLYHFFQLSGSRFVATYPIGIGQQGFNTPPGSYHITLKVRDPVWKVPDNIRQERPELPRFVQPGPDNPLGGYWLQLSINGYGIHGTNRPYGIGRRVSHGCIRLYPEDIEVLFKFVKSGTPVKIVNEPVKTAYVNGRVYIEVHCDEYSEAELVSIATKNLSGKLLLPHVDTVLLINAIRQATGLPALISK